MIPAPNYTQTPNIFFDEIMKTLNEGELRVLLLVMRQTFGWHKSEDWLTLSFLSKKTGYERRSVCRILERLIKKKLIFKRIEGLKGYQKCYYSLVTDYQKEEEPEDNEGIETEEEMAFFKKVLPVTDGSPPPSDRRVTPPVTDGSPTKERISFVQETSCSSFSHIPKSKNKNKKDLGIETEAYKKKQEKNLDAPTRWKLTEEQTETFHLLKSFDIDATEAKLCYWAKTYDAQRLIDVYNESKHNGARSLRQYMSKLLDEKKVVQNACIEANKQFAQDFMKENKWYGPKIHKKYMKIPLGEDWVEIDFNMNSRDFINRLMEKYDNFREINESS